MRYLFPLIAASLLAGCTIQQRMPVREVAYDFSDYAYYDRPYAESPEYRTDHSQPSSVESAPATAPKADAIPKAKGKVAINSPVAPAAGLSGTQGGNLCASPSR